MKTPTLALSALAAAVLSASAAPALADAPNSGALVTYSDLDLGTATGRYELSQRYDQAARAKCGIADGAEPKGDARICYKNTSKQYQFFAEALVARHKRQALALK